MALRLASLLVLVATASTSTACETTRHRGVEETLASRSSASDIVLPVDGDAVPVKAFRRIYRALMANDLGEARQAMADDTRDRLALALLDLRQAKVEDWLAEVSVACGANEDLVVRNVFVRLTQADTEELSGQLEVTLIRNDPIRETKTTFEYSCMDRGCSAMMFSPVNEFLLLVEEISSHHARCGSR